MSSSLTHRKRRRKKVESDTIDRKDENSKKKNKVMANRRRLIVNSISSHSFLLKFLSLKRSQSVAFKSIKTYLSQPKIDKVFLACFEALEFWVPVDMDESKSALQQLPAHDKVYRDGNSFVICKDGSIYCNHDANFKGNVMDCEIEGDGCPGCGGTSICYISIEKSSKGNYRFHARTEDTCYCREFDEPETEHFVCTINSQCPNWN